MEEKIGEYHSELMCSEMFFLTITENIYKPQGKSKIKIFLRNNSHKKVEFLSTEEFFGNNNNEILQKHVGK